MSAPQTRITVRETGSCLYEDGRWDEAEVPEGLDLPGIGNLAQPEEIDYGFAILINLSSVMGSMYLAGLGL
jgi:hypothetical protein